MKEEIVSYYPVYEKYYWEIHSEIFYVSVVEVLSNLPLNEPIILKTIKSKAKKRAKEILNEIYPKCKQDSIRFSIKRIVDLISDVIDLGSIMGVFDESNNTFTRIDRKTMIELQQKHKESIISKPIDISQTEIDDLLLQLTDILEDRFDGKLINNSNEYGFWNKNKDLLEILQKLADNNAKEIIPYLKTYLTEDHGDELDHIEVFELIRKLDDISQFSLPDLIKEFFDSFRIGEYIHQFEDEYSEEILKTIIHIDKKHEENKTLIDILKLINEECTYESEQMEWSIKENDFIDVGIGKIVIDEMIKRNDPMFIEVLEETIRGSIEILMHKAVIALGKINGEKNVPTLIRIAWRTIPQSYYYSYAEWAEDYTQLNSLKLAKEAEIILERMQIKDFNPYIEAVIFSVFKENCVINSYQPAWCIIDNLIEQITNL